MLGLDGLEICARVMNRVESRSPQQIPGLFRNIGNGLLEVSTIMRITL